MNFQQRSLRSSQEDFWSIFSSIIKFPINTKADIEKFFKNAVEKLSSAIPSERLSLILKGKDSAGYKKEDSGGYTVYMPINISEGDSEISIGYIRLQKEDGIDPEEWNFLNAMSYVIGMKFQNSILQLVIYEGLVQTLQVLVKTVEAKDVYTRFHSQRVAEYSLGIAEVLGLSEREKDILKIAGILHDIGKIAVPENILLKKGKLTEEEFEIIKLHAPFGNEILKPLRFFHHEREIILYHHERWDGSGYPEGLVGEEIPFLARILAVADSFDAMTSDRVYRKAMTFEDALKEIRELSGIKYDPVVVNAFEFYLRKKYLR